MDPFITTAIAAAVLAVIVLGFDGGDGWFFGLLAMACLLGSASESYKEQQVSALVFLLVGTFFAGMALRAAFAARRTRKAGD
jgi:hypothetical protein